MYVNRICLVASVTHLSSEKKHFTEFQSVDGTDIKEINLKRLRNLISVVSQEPILFDCSISENILYGLEPAAFGMDDVIEAARAANIHDYITSLPQV